MAYAAGVAPSEARGELRFTLEEDDIRHAASGEMVGGARTHTPPPMMTTSAVRLIRSARGAFGCLLLPTLAQDVQGRGRLG